MRKITLTVMCMGFFGEVSFGMRSAGKMHVSAGRVQAEEYGLVIWLVSDFTGVQYSVNIKLAAYITSSSMILS